MADVHEVQEANNKPNRKAKSFFLPSTSSSLCIYVKR